MPSSPRSAGGMTFGDSYDAQFPVLRTRDGGETWENIADNLPAAQPGEAGFAASGTCIKTLAGRSAWIGTGGAPRARVLSTTDGGDSWASSDVPIQPQGTPVSGVVSLDFRDRFHGILGGGDIIASTEPQLNVARSSDGGSPTAGRWVSRAGRPAGWGCGNGQIYKIDFKD